jgi:hypothetical protein
MEQNAIHFCARTIDAVIHRAHNPPLIAGKHLIVYVAGFRTRVHLSGTTERSNFLCYARVGRIGMVRRVRTVRFGRRDNRTMSKQAEADLILKLYDLRREATMRQARDWFAIEFNPESAADLKKTMFTEHGGHLRMVMSYWDMAAALVHNGAISQDFFNDTNGEHFMVFSRIEPILNEVRSEFGPQFLANLEKLVDATPNGRERCEMVRKRMKSIRAEVMAIQQQKAAGQS